MKILATGDKHLGLVSDGMSRLEEQRKILVRCVELLEETAADVYVDLGDLFDSPRPGPAAYALAFEYLRWIAEWMSEDEGRRAYVLGGNHDKPTRSEVNALSPLEGFERLPRILTIPMITPSPPNFLFLPFITEFEAKLQGFDSAQQWLEEESEAALKAVGGRIVVFSHLEVPGARNNDWDDSQRDVGLRVPAALLEDPRVVRVLGGHVHKYQRLERATVVGSALHVDFGEASDAKGAVLLEV